MKEHHLQLNLAKTELLVFPATPTLQHDFTIELGSSTITPSVSVRNLGVIFDDQMTFKEHIAKTARSCRFALHNIRKIRPFLTEHAAQLLVQALVISRLGLQCSSGWTSIKSSFNNWKSFTRSELKLESVHQESPHSDIFRKRATKPLLIQKHRQKHLTWAKEKKNWTLAQWSKVLFSDESKFCI